MTSAASSASSASSDVMRLLEATGAQFIDAPADVEAAAIANGPSDAASAKMLRIRESEEANSENRVRQHLADPALRDQLYAERRQQLVMVHQQATAGTEAGLTPAQVQEQIQPTLSAMTLTEYNVRQQCATESNAAMAKAFKEKVVDRACAVCSKSKLNESTLKLCGGCRSIAYCSAEHQKAHWRQHKPDCLARKAGHSAAAASAESNSRSSSDVADDKSSLDASADSKATGAPGSGSRICVASPDVIKILKDFKDAAYRVAGRVYSTRLIFQSLKSRVSMQNQAKIDVAINMLNQCYEDYVAVIVAFNTDGKIADTRAINEREDEACNSVVALAPPGYFPRPLQIRQKNIKAAVEDLFRRTGERVALAAI